MADCKAPIINTVKKEGGFQLTNRKNDLGGYTYAGISRKYNSKWVGWKLVDSLVASGKLIVNSKKEFVTDELKDAVICFYKSYWDQVRGDDINSQRVADFIFDFSVNAGADDAIPAAQRACGVKVDGILGKNTLLAINMLAEETFLSKYYDQVMAHYKRRVEKNPTQQRFLAGWQNRAKSHLI